MIALPCGYRVRPPQGTGPQVSSRNIYKLMQHCQAHIQLRPHLRAVPVKSHGVFLFDGDSYVYLEGALIGDLIRQIDSRQATSSDLEMSLEGQYEKDAIRSHLHQLLQDGFIYEEVREAIGPVDAFWSRLGLDPRTVSDLLVSNPVSVSTFGLDGHAARRAFENVGFRVEELGVPKIVIVKDVLHPAIQTLNLEALHASEAVVLVRLGAASTWLAFFGPGGSPCTECLRERLRESRKGRAFVENQLGCLLPESLPPFSEVHDWALWQAAVETVRWLASGTGRPASGVLFEIDNASGHRKAHRVVGIAGCAACGQPADADSCRRPLELRSRPKIGSVRNGTRSVAVQEAFDRVEHLLDPLLGPFSDLVPVSEPSGACSFVIRHGMAHNIDSVEKLKRAELHLSGGKGKNELEAKTSAIYEAIERYSGRWRSDLRVESSSLDELGPRAIHPNRLMGFSESQYRGRAEWNSCVGNPVLRVPEPFNSTEHMAWTPSWSLTHNRLRYVPASYAFYDYPVRGTRSCMANSNGCASGGNLEEAILQGAFELIERDALSIWWMNMIPRPGVDLNSYGDPYFLELLARYAAIGRTVWVLDITHDLDVPVMVAVSKQEEGVPNWVIGAGCHFDAGIAVSRALSEMDEMLPSLTNHVQAGIVARKDAGRGKRAWFQSAKSGDVPYLFPSESARRTAGDRVAPETDDILQDIELLVDRFREQDTEFLVVDQTDPTLGVPVARVMAPGLTMHWNRLGHERLYRVPVDLGWLDRAITEEATNPLPLPL